MDREVWRAAVQAVAKSQTWLSDWTELNWTDFIPFVTVVNGIVSLIYLFDFSLLVYGNARDYCVLILHSVTLLNALISSSGFLMALLWFSMYSIHLHDQGSPTSFFIYFINFLNLDLLSYNDWKDLWALLLTEMTKELFAATDAQSWVSAQT